MDERAFVIFSGRGDQTSADTEEEMRSYVALYRQKPLTSRQRAEGLTEQPVSVFARVVV